MSDCPDKMRWISRTSCYFLLENSKRLWLEHLSAHLCKSMFFNETLVIKWIPCLFHHETTGEDKNMCVICCLVHPLPLLSLFSIHSLSFFPCLCLILPPVFFFLLLLILPHKLSLSLGLRLISDSRHCSPVCLCVASLQLSALSLSLFPSPPAFITNSCDAAQQSLSEWYTSTITNKPKYLHSAGMICIDEYGAEEEWDGDLTVKKQLFPVSSGLVLIFILTRSLMRGIFIHLISAEPERRFKYSTL